MSDTGWGGYKANLDDKSEDRQDQRYTCQKGDRLLVLVEDTDIKQSASGNWYGANTLRIIAGPLNRQGQDAGPWTVQNAETGDEQLFSLRLWDNLTFSDKRFCQAKLKGFLRSLGHKGEVVFPGATHEERVAAWASAVLDKEFMVEVEPEEYQGQMRPKVRACLEVPLAEWQHIRSIYGEFGTARKGNWNTEGPFGDVLDPEDFDVGPVDSFPRAGQTVTQPAEQHKAGRVLRGQRTQAGATDTQPATTGTQAGTTADAVADGGASRDADGDLIEGQTLLDMPAVLALADTLQADLHGTNVAKSRKFVLEKLSDAVTRSITAACMLAALVVAELHGQNRKGMLDFIKDQCAKHKDSTGEDVLAALADDLPF